MGLDNWRSDLGTALQIGQTLSWENPEAAAFFGVANDVVALLFGGDSNSLQPVLDAIQKLQTNLEKFFDNAIQDQDVQNLLAELNTNSSWYQTAVLNLNTLQKNTPSDPTPAIDAIISLNTGYLNYMSGMTTPNGGTLYTLIQTLLSDPDFQQGPAYGVHQYRRVQIKFLTLLSAVSLLLSVYKAMMSMQQFVQQNTNWETDPTYGPTLDDTDTAVYLDQALQQYIGLLQVNVNPSSGSLFSTILARRMAAIGTFDTAPTVEITPPDFSFSASDDQSADTDGYCATYDASYGMGSGKYLFYNNNRPLPPPFTPVYNLVGGSVTPNLGPNDPLQQLVTWVNGGNWAAGGGGFTGYAPPDPLADPDPQQAWVLPWDIYNLGDHGPRRRFPKPNRESDALASYVSFATTATADKFAPKTYPVNQWQDCSSEITTSPTPPSTPVTISAWDSTAPASDTAWAVVSVQVRYAIYWARKAAPMGTAAKIWSEWYLVNSQQNPTLSNLPTTPAQSGDVLWVLRQFGVPTEPNEDPDPTATPVRPIACFPDASGNYPATYQDTTAAPSTLVPSATALA